MTSGPRSTSPSDSFSWRPFINHFAWCHAFNFGAFLHTRAGYSCGSLYFQREYGVHNRSASIHVEDLAGHPTRFLHADEHRCIRDVLRGPSSPRGTPPDFMPGFNRLLHLRWETNQYTAIDQVSCTEDDARAEWVHGDTTPGKGYGEVAHQRLHCGFCRSHPHPGLPTPRPRPR